MKGNLIEIAYWMIILITIPACIIGIVLCAGMWSRGKGKKNGR